MTEENQNNGPSSPTPKSPMKTLCMLVMLGALGALGFWQMQQQHSLQVWTKNAQIQSKTIADLQSQINHQRQEKHAPQTFWRLEQAREYVQMAKIKSELEDRPRLTNALLTAAFNTLQDVNAPDIKSKLQESIVFLQKQPGPNMPAINAALRQAKQQVSNLELSHPSMKGLRESSPPADAVSPHWQQKIWAKLQQAVIIRQSDDTIKPLLTQAQQNLLRANLTVALDLAQWGLLHRDLSAFHSGLDQCMTWIDGFASQNEMTRALAKQLQMIKNMPSQEASLDFSAILSLFAPEQRDPMEDLLPSELSQPPTPPLETEVTQ